MQVTPHVYAIQVPESELMRPQFTNIYLVGRNSAIMVDSGEDNERFQTQMKEELGRLGQRRITDVVVTHSHFDHSGGLGWVREATGARLRAHPQAIAELEEKFGKGSIEPLMDGQVLEADGASLEVIYTPGHNDNSVCYFLREEGVLFTGDTILGVGTVTIRDLLDYMNSLHRLRELELKIIGPGHGPLITDPKERVREYIAHRQMREDQIVAALKAWPKDSWQLVKTIYWDVDPRLHRAAEGNVLTHLRKLEREERVWVHTGWQPPVYQLVESKEG